MEAVYENILKKRAEIHFFLIQQDPHIEVEIV